MDKYDDHILAYHADLAMALLRGRVVRSRNGIVVRTEYLSQHTKPSEREARGALIDLLDLIRRKLTDQRLAAIVALLVVALAEDRDLKPGRKQQYPLRLVTKRRSTGHPDRARDHNIALLVHLLRRDGSTREDAISRVARAHGYKDTRTVEKIYDRDKETVARRWANKSTDSTASDG